MSVVENNTLVLSNVEELREEASSSVNLIVEDSGIIKRHNLNTYIMSKFTPIEEAIGESRGENEPTGFYKKFEETNNSLENIYTILGEESDELNEGTGFYKEINNLKNDVTTLKTKTFLEGYRSQFIETIDNINLLNKTESHEFNFKDCDLNISDCIRNSSGYSVNINLTVSYQMRPATDNYITDKIYSTITFNLNTSNSSSIITKQLILPLPLANAVIILLARINNNTITITVKDYKNTTNLNTDEMVKVEFAELIINKVDLLDPSDSEIGEDIEEPLVNIPLTLIFDKRDLLSYGDSSNKLEKTEMLYGSRIKFDHTDIAQGVALIVKYNDTSITYRNPSEDNNTDTVQYLGDNASKRGNVLTTADNDNIIPAPQIVYYNSVYSNFGLDAPGIWFKYWPNLSANIQSVTFTNYNYDGENHEIIYRQVPNSVTIDGHEYGRVDSFCIPIYQWRQYFTNYNTHQFNIQCTLNGTGEISNIKTYRMYNSDKKLSLFLENDEVPAIVALDYADNTSANSIISGIRTGIYLRKDILQFKINLTRLSNEE